MSQHDHGLCDEWDANAGGNRAFVFGADAVHIPTPPGDGIALLDESCAVRFGKFDAEDYTLMRRLRSADDVRRPVRGRSRSPSVGEHWRWRLWLRLPMQTVRDCCVPLAALSRGSR
jgi:hypothetical protein